MQKSLQPGNDQEGIGVKHYAVIDTNVLVSAMLKWNSIPGKVVEFALRGTVIPLVNDKILNEYRDVLSREKFGFTKDIIEDVLAGIIKQAVFLSDKHIDVALPDPKDAVFYQVVMEQRNTDEAYLVTGNIKHFPMEPYIVTPKQFLDIIIEKKQIRQANRYSDKL